MPDNYNKLSVYHCSGISADYLRLQVKNTSDEILFEKKYYYGYNASYEKSWATEDKPFTDDIILQISWKYSVPSENITHYQGENIFKEGMNS